MTKKKNGLIDHLVILSKILTNFWTIYHKNVEQKNIIVKLKLISRAISNQFQLSAIPIVVGFDPITLYFPVDQNLYSPRLSST